MRIVKIKTQSMNHMLEKETDARTFGELKQEFAGEVDFNDMAVIDRATRVSYEFDDSVLPDGDFSLFLFVKNIKGGIIRRIPLITQESIAERLSLLRVAINELLEDFIEDLREELNDLDDVEDDVLNGNLEESSAIISEYNEIASRL